MKRKLPSAIIIGLLLAALPSSAAGGGNAMPGKSGAKDGESGRQAAAPEEAAYPDLDLSNLKPSKVSVLGGAALAGVVRSESGYLLPVEGKILYAFDGAGNTVWTHGLSSRVDSLTPGLGGILYAVSRKTALCMISPGGRELWKARPGFSMEGEPLPGRDGRVFVRGSGNIACYGLKGTRRWTLQLAGQDTRLPLLELNDGRLLVFLAKTEDGRSCAVTVSPFGEAMEELTFSGIVAAAAACGDGVLLSFADGSIGLCSVQGGKSQSSWIRPAAETRFSAAAAIVPELPSGRTAAFLSGSPARLLYVDTKSGAIESEAKTTLNAASLRYKAVTAQGLAFADSSAAECYSMDAIPVWKAHYTDGAAWSHMFISDEGFIHFFGKDWVISSYRVKQNLSAGQDKPFSDKKAGQYHAFYSGTLLPSSDVYGRAISGALALEMMEDWQKGNYAEREQGYLSLLDSEISSLGSAYSSLASARASGGQSYFLTHPAYCQELVALSASSQLASFAPAIARLLLATSGSPLSHSLVKAAGETAFDADGSLLDALLYTARHTPTAGSDGTLMSICDATYEICRFMGRPAFIKKGNAILGYFLSPQFSQKLHDYAKKTLDRIIEENL